MTVFKKIVIF